jgi:hypothetical protein
MVSTVNHHQDGSARAKSHCARKGSHDQVNGRCTSIMGSSKNQLVLYKIMPKTTIKPPAPQKMQKSQSQLSQSQKQLLKEAMFRNKSIAEKSLSENHLQTRTHVLSKLRGMQTLTIVKAVSEHTLSPLEPCEPQYYNSTREIEVGVLFLPSPWTDLLPSLTA